MKRVFSMMESNDGLTSLPDELLMLIFSFILSSSTFLSLRCVNRRLCLLISSIDLWTALYNDRDVKPSMICRWDKEKLDKIVESRIPFYSYWKSVKGINALKIGRPKTYKRIMYDHTDFIEFDMNDGLLVTKCGFEYRVFRDGYTTESTIVDVDKINDCTMLRVVRNKLWTIHYGKFAPNCDLNLYDLNTLNGTACSSIWHISTPRNARIIDCNDQTIYYRALHKIFHADARSRRQSIIYQNDELRSALIEDTNLLVSSSLGVQLYDTRFIGNDPIHISSNHWWTCIMKNGKVAMRNDNSNLIYTSDISKPMFGVISPSTYVLDYNGSSCFVNDSVVTVGGDTDKKRNVWPVTSYNFDRCIFNQYEFEKELDHNYIGTGVIDVRNYEYQVAATWMKVDYPSPMLYYLSIFDFA